MRPIDVVAKHKVSKQTVFTIKKELNTEKEKKSTPAAKPRKDSTSESEDSDSSSEEIQAKKINKLLDSESDSDDSDSDNSSVHSALPIERVKKVEDIKEGKKEIKEDIKTKEELMSMNQLMTMMRKSRALKTLISLRMSFSIQ